MPKTQAVYLFSGLVSVLLLKYLFLFKRTGLMAYFYGAIAGVVGAPVFLLSAIFYDRIGQNVNMEPIFISIIVLIALSGILSYTSPIVWNYSKVLLKSPAQWIKSNVGILPYEIRKVKDVNLKIPMLIVGLLCFFYPLLFILITNEPHLDVILIIIEITGFAMIGIAPINFNDKSTVERIVKHGVQ